MSRTYRKTGKAGDQERHISVRAVRRHPPDLRKLSRALIELAIAEAAAEALASSVPGDYKPSAQSKTQEPHDER